MKKYGYIFGLFIVLPAISCAPELEKEIVDTEDSVVEENDDKPEIPVPKGYELVWNDEFDEPGRPNAEYWSFESGFVRNEELQWYQQENAVIEDGLLTIEGRRERHRNPNYQSNSGDWRKSREFYNYTSASIKTRNKFSFKYGIMEVRARIDTRKGAWPAIWTLGISRGWPDGGEVDVMEMYRINDVPHLLANAAWKGKERWVPTWNSAKIRLSHFVEKDPNWEKKFHTWKMEWDSEYIRLYVDDELLNEIMVSLADYADGFNPFRQPHYILLNLAIGSNGGNPSKTDFPLTYEINYVRVFQKIADE